MGGLQLLVLQSLLQLLETLETLCNNLLHNLTVLQFLQLHLRSCSKHRFPWLVAPLAKHPIRIIKFRIICYVPDTHQEE